MYKYEYIGLNKNKNYYKDLDLEELVIECQKDDYQAIEELIRRQQKKIYATFYYLDSHRDDIVDLTQEVLLRMARGIKKLRNPKTFKGWLNQIITNLFYDELRKKSKRLKTVSIDSSFTDDEKAASFTKEIPDSGKMPCENSLGNELDDIIKESIQKLPEQFRIVIVLRELQGLSYEEIAEVTDTSIGTVKSRIARARVKLQDLIKPYLV